MQWMRFDRKKGGWIFQLPPLWLLHRGKDEYGEECVNTWGGREDGELGHKSIDSDKCR